MVAFAVPCAGLIALALLSGGYDIVVRQAAGLVVWVALALAVALGYLPRRMPSREVLVPLAGLVALVAWTALSLLWTSSSEATVAELARVLFYAGLVLLAWGTLGETTWRSAAAGIATAAVVVCAVAVVARLTGELGDPAIASIQGRLTYPLYYWNAVGAWGAISIALALGWSASAQQTAVRAAFSAAVPLCGLTVYLTYSRAGVIAVVVAVLTALALSANRWVLAAHAAVAAAGTAVTILVVRAQPQIADATGTAGAGKVAGTLAAAMGACAVVTLVVGALQGDARWRLPVRPARVAVAALAVIFVVGGLAVAGGRISQAWDEFRHQPLAATPAADPSQRLTTFAGGRYKVWTTAIDTFEASPLGGEGAGTFEFAWNRSGGREFARDGHSLYFETAAELGVVGILALLLLIGGLVAGGWLARHRLRRRHAVGAAGTLVAGFGVYLVSAGVDWMWEVTAVTALGLSCGAVACSAARTRRLRLPPAARVVLVGVAVGAAALQLPGLFATSAVRESQKLARANSLDAATESASDAIDSAPWAASGYVQRALIAERRHRYDAARDDLAAAIEREPENWRPYLLLARVEHRAGKRKEALDQLRQARRLRPASPFVRTLKLSRSR